MTAHAGAAARLEHILDAIRHVETFTSGRTLDDYLRDPMLRFAVERGIEIVSEASRHIPKTLKDRHGHLPWREIAAIGNVLRHDYERVDDRELWKGVSRHFPLLKDTVESMLREVGAGDAGKDG